MASSSSRIFLFIIFLISAVSCRSDRSFHHELRELPQRVDYSSNPIHMMSPSPSPPLSLGSENAPSPLTRQERLTCDNVANKCNIQNYSVTACVPFVGSGAQASYIVVLNDGESSLQLNFAVLPENRTLEGLAISGHQVKKVNLPSDMRGDTSILLNVGNEECTILLFSAMIPQGSYTSYITSINATYLFFAAALFIGGSWACCKVVKRKNHLYGIPYQELQMEERDSESTHNVGGWDQNWDEDWDDENKAAKPPGTVRTRKVSENRDTYKYVK